LINARAEELPLPDGCVVIRRTEAEREIWKDALTALAILTKCSDVIWLRDKHPALQAAFERGAATTLLVPPGFASRLPVAEPAEATVGPFDKLRDRAAGSRTQSRTEWQ
jgi:hypothetical protein